MKEEIREKPVTKIIKYPVYISNNNKEFESKEDCIKYERSLVNLKTIRYYLNDFDTWFYISDENDLETLKQYLEDTYYKVWYENDEELNLIGTWVSYIRDEGDCSTTIILKLLKI